MKRFSEEENCRMFPVMCEGSFPSPEKQGQNSACEQFCENSLNFRQRMEKIGGSLNWIWRRNSTVKFVFGKV